VCGDNTSYYCYAKPNTVIPLVVCLTLVVLASLTAMYFLIRRREKIARATGIPYTIMGADSSRWFRLVVFVVMGLMVLSYAICSLVFIPINSGTEQGSVDTMFWLLTVSLAFLMVIFAMYIAKANSNLGFTQPLMSPPVVYVDGVHATPSPYNPTPFNATPGPNPMVKVPIKTALPVPISPDSTTEPANGSGSGSATAHGHVHAGPVGYTTFNNEAEERAEGQQQGQADHDTTTRS